MRKPKSKGPTVAKRASFGGIVSAFCVILLYFGSIIEVIDLTVAAYASLVLVTVISELGKKDAFIVFSVTALTSLILLPRKEPAIMYLVFGYYPIIKPVFDKLKPLPQWVLKMSAMNFALAVYLVTAHFIFTPDADITDLLWLTVFLTNIGFVVFDIALNRFVRLWVLKLRSVFRLK